MKEARKTLKAELDRQPTHKELAEKLEISEKKLHRLIRASKKAKVAPIVLAKETSSVPCAKPNRAPL